MEILPFVRAFYTAGRWALSLARERQGARYVWWFFGITASIVLLIDIAGFIDSQRSAAQKHWTAASFALVGAMLECALVPAVAWLVRYPPRRKPLF